MSDSGALQDAFWLQVGPPTYKRHNTNDSTWFTSARRSGLRYSGTHITVEIIIEEGTSQGCRPGRHEPRRLRSRNESKGFPYLGFVGQADAHTSPTRTLWDEIAGCRCRSAMPRCSFDRHASMGLASITRRRRGTAWFSPRPPDHSAARMRLSATSTVPCWEPRTGKEQEQPEPEEPVGENAPWGTR